MEIKEDNTTPTVNIGKYTLIEDPNISRKIDAEQIMKVKRTWPLVMQMPTREGYETILAQNFTFSAEGYLLNREDYISDRIKPSDWQITQVYYDNLTLQFFNNNALLSYRNEVTVENKLTKEIEIEFMSWADIYILEQNKWKIGAAHVVDYRLEKK